MRVLGLDPGLHRTGVAVVDGRVGEMHLRHAECLETPPSISDPARLALLFGLLDRLLSAHRPEVAAVEKLFFASNRRSAMRVAEARGVATCVLARHHLDIAEYTPLQVKESVAGWGGAPKAQVAQMTSTWLGLDSIPGPDDVTDACAIAVCHHNRAPLASLDGGVARTAVVTGRDAPTPALRAAIAAARAGPAAGPRP